MHASFNGKKMALLLSEKEIELLLADLIDFHGYDFSGYSKLMLHRRINRLFGLRAFTSFSTFRFLLASNPEFFRFFIAEVMIPVTEMFRDPSFFLMLREEILPQLNKYPLIRIWHAGCSTGEEVYSVAILLQELNLLQKSILYATDINPEALHVAATGLYLLETMKQYAENYIQAGGKFSLNNYYLVHNNLAKLDDQLKKRVVFSTHNLAADTSFNQFQLIICRNVLIYFNQELQNHVFTLFDASLENNGFLALGSKETLRFTTLSESYQRVNSKEKIWRKL